MRAYVLLLRSVFVLTGGVCDRGYQQRGYVCGYTGEERDRNGRGAEGGIEAFGAIQDVREDLPASAPPLRYNNNTLKIFRCCCC